MGTPREALPTITIDEIQSLLSTLPLPPTSNIEILTTEAEYHIIALIQFQSQDPQDAILRIAGSHIPRLKTENEVTVIKWIQQNTSIPVPSILHYDSSTDNPLKCEYILQEKLPGKSLDQVWPSLPEDEKLGVLNFAADFLRQLARVEWRSIGSLNFTGEEYASNGPILDERFWEQRDIQKFWPTDEIIESLNPIGPYNSYVEYSIARIEKYVYAIRRHPSLEYARKHVSLIEQFVELLKEKAETLSRGARLCLAHRDFHMGNIMYDTTEKKVSGVLDWEFSIVLPLQQGDLSRAFLYDLQGFEGWEGRREEMLRVVRRSCEGDGLGKFEFSSVEQREMQRVVDLLRAVVEVSPRGQRVRERVGWIGEGVGIMRWWIQESGRDGVV